MKKGLPKIVAIVGPTASGKSDLAVAIAKKFNGEVISADSRQLYKGLDIGTGKITKKDMQGIPHHLLDVADPKKQFSVDTYKTMADKAIAKILAQRKLPILCGGTGFYVDAVAQNILMPDVPPNPKLRKSLSKKSITSLFAMLQRIDANRASAIDKNNKVRIIRAIEIAKELGKVPKIKANPKYDTLYIGINWSPNILKEKIRNRLLHRIYNGMIEEAKRLHKQGLSWKRMDALGLEYRYLAQYLQSKISKAEMIERLSNEIWHYAKRQMTWFKRNKNIVWTNPNKLVNIQRTIKKFLVS